MSKKAVIISLISVCVVGGAIYGGIKLYQDYQFNSLTAEVQSVSNLNMYYGGSEMSSSGMLTNDYSQEVYPLEDKNILEVFVEEGQTVEAGDPLVSFDMTLANLELEMKELDVATTAGKIQAAKQELEKLKKTKPIQPKPEQPEQPEEPVEPVVPDVPQEPEEPPKPEKNGAAFNFITLDSKPNTGKGTEEDPYVYLCMPDCYVLGEFINNLSRNEQKPVYVSLEIHKNNTLKGKLLSRWEISGKSGFPMMADESRWSVSSRSQIVEEEIEEPEIPEEPEEPDVPEEAPEIEEQEGYTAQELAEKIQEKEKEIRDLDLEKRQGELELEQMKKISSDGIIKAEINGVVKELSELDNLPVDGSPILTVAGSEGLYVKGYLSELQLEDIEVGQTVYAYSWESGNNFEASITEISTYPSTNYESWGEGNPNVSYYPYTAYIENTEGLHNGEYVDLTMTPNNAGQQSDSIYIEKAYVRQEDNRKYVMKEDKNSCLVKQYVKTGKTAYGSVEILSGLSMEDKIAFPYGKTAKEGVKVKSSD